MATRTETDADKGVGMLAESILVVAVPGLLLGITPAVVFRH
jgi:hypothetical protein